MANDDFASCSNDGEIKFFKRNESDQFICIQTLNTSSLCSIIELKNGDLVSAHYGKIIIWKKTIDIDFKKRKKKEKKETRSCVLL